LQESLTIATFLSELAPICGKHGLNVEIAAQVEVANALRDQGELSASVRVLRNLENHADFRKQTVAVTKPEILANLVSLHELQSNAMQVTKYSRANKSLKHGYSNRKVSLSNILSLQCMN
jgi:ataxia telangiectasia mutated family protein